LRVCYAEPLRLGVIIGFVVSVLVGFWELFVVLVSV
jgi:hypothetical protein